MIIMVKHKDSHIEKAKKQDLNFQKLAILYQKSTKKLKSRLGHSTAVKTVPPEMLTAAVIMSSADGKFQKVSLSIRLMHQRSYFQQPMTCSCRQISMCCWFIGSRASNKPTTLMLAEVLRVTILNHRVIVITSHL